MEDWAGPGKTMPKGLKPHEQKIWQGWHDRLVQQSAASGTSLMEYIPPIKDIVKGGETLVKGAKVIKEAYGLAVDVANFFQAAGAGA